MNLQPGTLAIITKAHLVENVGKIVTCAEFVGTNHAFPGRSDIWIIRFQSPSNAQTYMPDGSMQVMKFLWAHIPAAWLKPVSGLPDSDSTDRETKLPNLVEELA
jgi:hypothetical protein